MSTHSHEVITDVRGRYPLFLQTLHRNLALCTKAYRGWPEEVFNKRSTSVHALLTPEAMMESIAYLIANPVEAGAVRYAKDWLTQLLNCAERLIRKLVEAKKGRVSRQLNSDTKGC
jgi:hypothetical protein